MENKLLEDFLKMDYYGKREEIEEMTEHLFNNLSYLNTVGTDEEYLIDIYTLLSQVWLMI